MWVGGDALISLLFEAPQDYSLRVVGHEAYRRSTKRRIGIQHAPTSFGSDDKVDQAQGRDNRADG
jgi:hypothetical protein